VVAGKKAWLLFLIALSLALTACSKPASQKAEEPANSKSSGTQQCSIEERLLIQAGGLVFDPAAGKPAIPAELDTSGQPRQGRYLYIVQLKDYGAQAAALREKLAAAGAALSDHYIPDNAVLAMMDREQAAKVKALDFVRAVVPYLAAYKIDASLKTAGGDIRPDIGQIPIMVTTWTVADKPEVLGIVRQLGGEVLDGADSHTNRLAVALSKEQVLKLVQSPLVVKMARAVPQTRADSGGTKQTVDYG